jgi:dicarboxylate transporter 10
VIGTHLACSAAAGVCGAAFTMPFDVMKTRMMNATPGTYRSVAHCFRETAASGGLRAFYSGFGPAAIRIIPQTVLTWVFKEQLRLNFGYFPEPSDK